MDGMNAKIGQNNKNKERMIWKHSIGKINKNKGRLAQFCGTINEWKEVAYSPHKSIHKQPGIMHPTTEQRIKSIASR